MASSVQPAAEEEWVNPAMPLPAGVLPYSLSTGIPKGGAPELSGYLRSIRAQGFCCIERAIPAAEVSAVRESVIEGHRLIKEALPHGTWSVVPRGSNEPDPVTGVRPMHPPAGASHCFPSQSFAHIKLIGPRRCSQRDHFQPAVPQLPHRAAHAGSGKRHVLSLSLSLSHTHTHTRARVCLFRLRVPCLREWPWGRAAALALAAVL